ncbi:MAG: Periplasmic serine endoprotease DegP [Bacteroidota bacterium]|nr:MAG: Periplasmic serine endoprotease DegP [Bacteroidota bacterium]
MKSILKTSIIAVVSAFVAVLVFSRIQEKKPIYSISTPQVFPTNYTVPTTTVSAMSTDFTVAAEKTIDAVVHITNTSVGRSRQPSNIWEYFYNTPSREYPRIGMGSGVIVSSDGYIITNNHVIEDASEIEVTTNDNKIYEAELVGTDPSADIAVLRINSDQVFPYVRFADSDLTRIGEWVLAVGNPYNLNSTVTAGIISAKSRDLSSYDSKNQSFIQTDAAVNSGNSGGALVNLDGDLIGINTAITSNGMGTFIGYSFAVPSNMARKIYEDIVEFGNVQKALLGVTGNGLNARIAEELGIEETEGFYVAGLEESMGAKEAGLQEEDVIIKINDAPIRKFADLTGYLGSKRPGDRVNVTFLRNGEEKTLSVELKRTPFISYYGMRLRELTKKEAEKLDLSEGVHVSAVQNGRLYRRGVQKGDVLLSVNGKDISTTDDVLALDEDSIYELEFMNQDKERMRFIFE